MRTATALLLALLIAAHAEAQVVQDCGANARGWRGMTLVDPPPKFVWWQSGGVCNIAIRSVTGDWDSNDALALLDGSEDARTVEASLRFGADARLRDGWLAHYTDCDQECLEQDPQAVADAGWCAVLGASETDPSMLIACPTAPNGLEGASAQWLNACDPSGPHNLTSVLMVAYRDHVGTWFYGPSKLVPILPLEGAPNPWIRLRLSAREVGGRITARVALSYVGADGPESHDLTASFIGRLTPGGRAGLRFGMEPQSFFCLGPYGRPVRVGGSDWVVAQ